MWKILHGKTSNDLHIKFNSRSRLGIQAAIPSLSRDSSPKHQSMYDSSFAVQGPKLWNALPTNINTVADFASFKIHLTEILLVVPDQPPVRAERIYMFQLTASLAGGHQCICTLGWSTNLMARLNLKKPDAGYAG